jgi:hypothetical protein
MLGNQVLARRPGCVGTDTPLMGTLASQLVAWRKHGYPELKFSRRANTGTYVL